MSVANRDDAIKCRQLAEVAIASGDSDKAARLLEKSLRMYNDPQTVKLLEQAKSGPAVSRTATSTSEGSSEQPKVSSQATGRPVRFERKLTTDIISIFFSPGTPPNSKLRCDGYYGPRATTRYCI